MVRGQTFQTSKPIIREVVVRTLLVVAALALSLQPALAQQAPHVMVNADEVKWKEAPPILPGAQISVLYGDPAKDGVFVMRLKFPANYRVPAHTHPVDEIVTVISGEFNIGMGREFDKAQTKPYKAGGLVAMPPGTEHFVYTDEETIIQISTQGPWALNFVNPGDKAQVTR
jgi:quercetin dioxygenase-like cupin family protein